MRKNIFTKMFENEPEDFSAPLHMSRGARNFRLYNTLKDMGLDVCPIFEDEETDEIKEIIVSA